ATVGAGPSSSALIAARSSSIAFFDSSSVPHIRWTQTRSTLVARSSSPPTSDLMSGYFANHQSRFSTASLLPCSARLASDKTAFFAYGALLTSDSSHAREPTLGFLPTVRPPPLATTLAVPGQDQPRAEQHSGPLPQ